MCEEACPAAGARIKWKLSEHDYPTPVGNLSGTLENVGATKGTVRWEGLWCPRGEDEAGTRLVSEGCPSPLERPPLGSRCG